MKKTVLVVLTFVTLLATVSAQGGGGNRRTAEERAAAIHARLDSAFKVDASKLTTLRAALVVSFKSQDAKRREMMSAGGTPDREAMQAELRKFADERDALIKAALTAEQFATWKEKLEPSMRPQRQGGGNQ